MQTSDELNYLYQIKFAEETWKQIYETIFKAATEAPLDPMLKLVISSVEGIPTRQYAGDGPSGDTRNFPRN